MDLTRNWLFIDPQTQESILNRKILFAGCGLGSYIASSLTRIGFKNFIIADGDTVSPSNLNRQYFNTKDLGLNKADSCSSNIKEINPEASVISIPKFLESKDLEELIPQVDIVINAIDFESTAFIDCNKLINKLDKIEIFSVNLGYAGCTMVFDKSTPSISDFFNTTDPLVLKFKFMQWVVDNHGSAWLKEKFEQFKVSPNNIVEPQIIPAILINSSIVTKIAVDLCEGLVVKKFPEVYFIEVT